MVSKQLWVKLQSYKDSEADVFTKMSLENKHFENGDYFVIIASSSPALLLTEHAANGMVEVVLCPAKRS